MSNKKPKGLERYRNKVVDLNKYKPKTNGKNGPLFIELKRIEMEMFSIMDKYNVDIEDQIDLKKYFARMRDVINHSEVTKVNNTRKKHKYRVAITVNGRRKSIIDNWINLEPATNCFNSLKEEGLAVDLPKTSTHTRDGATNVKYEVLLLKSYEPGDVRRYRRDEMGKIYQEDYFDDGTWVILDSADYYIEETFKVFGYDANDRFDVRRIISEIIPKHKDKYPMKQMYFINHRVYLEYGNKMDVITAHDMETAEKLYRILSNTIVNAGINTVFCIGQITDADTVTEKYNEIQRVTGWTRRKITRTSTHR